MKNFIITCAVFLLVQQGMAACPQTPVVSVYFVNGMNTSLSSARAQTLALEHKVRPSLPTGVTVNFSYSYNANESDTRQIVQVLSQTLNDKSIPYYQWLSNPSSSPALFQTALQSLEVGSTVSSYVNDPDLQTHVQKYAADLAAGKKVVLVAHSQGNFYANRAYEQLASTSLGIVSVGTPSSYTAGNGPYTTLTTDLVIQSILQHRSANTTNGALFLLNVKDNQGHSFRKSYLNGDVSGPKIVSQIVSQITTLPCPAL